MRTALVIIVGLFCFLGLWELGCRWSAHMAFALPPPSAVFASFATRGDRYWLHTLVTLREMVAAFVLALSVALPTAWAMASYRDVRWLLQPLFVTVQCVPMFALAPLMVIWCGWGFTAIVIPTALMVFFPLVLTICQGLRNTPTSLLEYFKLNGATPWQTFYKLRLPYAVPHLFAGFRVAAASAGIGAVAGEWAGAQEGLGILMLESRRATDLTTTFGGLFCLAAVSMGLYLIVTLFERITLPPRPKWMRRKQGWKSQVAVVLLVPLLALVVGSCSNSEKPHVHLVLDWLPNPDHVPLYVGVDRGFFEDEGIPLRISKLQDPGDVVPLVTAGKVQLGVSYMPHTLRSAAEGAPLQVVGVLFKQPLNALIFRTDSGIVTPPDLEGKTIGYSLGGFDEAFIASMNLAMGDQRNVHFDLISSLGTGQVDAVYGAYWNIECVHWKHLGVLTDHFPLSTFGIPNYYELIVVAKQGSGEWSGFRRALQRSIDWCCEHPDEAFAIYTVANPDKSPETLHWEREAWSGTHPLLTADQELEADCFREFHDWLRSHDGLIVGDVDLGALLAS